MTEEMQNRRDHGFVMGLVTGTFVGAGLALWLTPRAVSELRRRVTGSAKAIGTRASERYQQASGRVSEAMDDLTKKGQSVRDDMADAVVRGAHDVARRATSLKTDPAASTPKSQ